jgi:hypothetical protein
LWKKNNKKKEEKKPEKKGEKKLTFVACLNQTYTKS